MYQDARGELRSSERLGQDDQDRCLSEAWIAKRKDGLYSRRAGRRIARLCNCGRNTEDGTEDKQTGM